MRNICKRFAQVRTFLCQCAIYVQDLRKILSLMFNICPRFAQDCTYFPNAQYMHKIHTRLYFFLQCAIYAQDLHKIVLLSPMRSVPKNLLESGEQCIVGSPFNFVFSGCLTRRKINAARIVLFKSRNKVSKVDNQ